MTANCWSLFRIALALTVKRVTGLGGFEQMEPPNLR